MSEQTLDETMLACGFDCREHGPMNQVPQRCCP